MPSGPGTRWQRCFFRSRERRSVDGGYGPPPARQRSSSARRKATVSPSSSASRRTTGTLRKERGPFVSEERGRRRPPVRSRLIRPGVRRGLHGLGVGSTPPAVEAVRLELTGTEVYQEPCAPATWLA